MHSPTVLALIPARAGSKSLRDKNIYPFKGKPLLAHSIEQALACEAIHRVLVSTDSEEYARIAREYGAETPFLRPPEFAQDNSTDLEVFHHTLTWMKENEGAIPDICVHLRPTYPIRDTRDITACIEQLASDNSLDSVRSISPVPITPYKMWTLGDADMLVPVMSSDLREPYNMPRQQLPRVYYHNGCIDVVRSSVILEQGLMSGTRIRGHLMDHFFDIDDLFDLEKAGTGVLPDVRGRTFAFDIDGVLATIVRDMRYDTAGPIHDSIALVNRLYDAGNTIFLYTARGTMTGLDWRAVTERQMQDWGVKYHRLYMGKPGADYYIDDRFTSLHLIETALRLGNTADSYSVTL